MSKRARTDADSEQKDENNQFQYLSGFGNHLESEALKGALPVGQNSPQVCPYGLYAEQLSGTSFTTPRTGNQKAWFYRIRPTVCHAPIVPVEPSSNLVSKRVTSDFAKAKITPNQFRWAPYPLPADEQKVDFLQGLSTVCGAGSPEVKTGLAIHVYACNTSMVDKGFVNSDGDLLIVPQLGTLTIRTEYGYLRVPPTWICVIQRGIVFSVEVSETSRGYICEVFNGHYKLPDLGPIGSNGLANPRDFLHPTASFEDRLTKFTVVNKFIGEWFYYERDNSPFDVVAWHGNYVPYIYDLNRFCPAGAVAFDHMDPSIFTVLTCATAEPGVACADFVIFPPRYAVQEHTFRPPYYHRNCMSEYMGNICGKYEAKPDGFLPGGGSLHSCMAGHGPDAATFHKASSEELKPMKLPTDSLAFMFESTYLFKVTDWALNESKPDPNYYQVWQGIKSTFDPNWKPS